MNRREVVFGTVRRRRDIEVLAARLGEWEYVVHTWLLETVES